MRPMLSYKFDVTCEGEGVVTVSTWSALLNVKVVVPVRASVMVFCRPSLLQSPHATAP
jgi:hypothetical protein